MTKSTKEFLNPKTLMAPAGYTHIARASGGTTIYIAGQVSSDEAGKLIGENNFEAQAEQVCSAISRSRSKLPAAPWPTLLR